MILFFLGAYLTMVQFHMRIVELAGCPGLFERPSIFSAERVSSLKMPTFQLEMPTLRRMKIEHTYSSCTLP